MTAGSSLERGAVTDPPSVTAPLTAPASLIPGMDDPDPAAAAGESGGWTVLASPATSAVRPPVSLRRIVVQAVVLVALVVAVVGAA
ncbi:MAG TPA: hypothetical protein VHZ96_23600, partial [Frankiaceae bacterium]|nr:hypothetical protein [Frankiaceae bacterium]